MINLNLKDYKRCMTSFNQKKVLGERRDTVYDEQQSVISDMSLQKRLSSLDNKSTKSPLSLLRKLTLSKEDLVKEDIINSIEYKLKKGIHS